MREMAALRQLEENTQEGESFYFMVPDEVTTDAELSSLLCPQLRTSYTYGWMSTVAQLAIPECLASASNMSSLSLIGAWVLNSFGHLPPNMSRIYFHDTKFALNTVNSVKDGFKPDGSLDWVELFEVLPSLGSLIVERGNLRTTLPDTIPVGFELEISDIEGLSGSVPSTLFDRFMDVPSTHSPLSFRLKVNWGRLTGPIPANLFAPLAGKTFSKFSFSIVANLLLTGPLPNPLPDTMVMNGTGDVEFEFALARNRLSGSIPANFVVPLLGSGAHVMVDLSGNELTGTYPSAFFQSMSPLRTFSFLLHDNQLNGTLPSKMLTATLQPSPSLASIDFAVRYNRLTGTIPEQFFTSTFPTDLFPTPRLSLDFNGNSFTGYVNPLLIRDRIDRPLFLQQLTLNVGGGSLSGTLPSSLLSDVFDASASDLYITLDFSRNNLEGTIPDAYAELLGSHAMVDLRLDHNRFTGSIPAFCSPGTHFSYPYPWYRMFFNNNQLNGTLPEAWNSSCGLYWVDVSSNVQLNGTIPKNLLNNTRIDTFRASDTDLTGDLPPVHPNVRALDLSSTKVSFCSNASQSSLTHPEFECKLRCTEAASCSSAYYGCDVTCKPCVPAAAPSADFECLDGIWTAASVSNSTTLVVLRGASMAISGDLLADTVEFHQLPVGLSALRLGGCAPNLKTVSLRLTAAEVDAIYNNLHGGGSSYSFISFDSRGPLQCHDASKLAIKIHPIEGTCRKPTLKPQFYRYPSNEEYFNGFCTINTSGCNRWWIILISVLIPVIVVGIVITIVAVVLCGKKSSA